MDTSALPEVSTTLLDEARAHSARRAARTLCGGTGHALRQTAIALLAGSTLSDHENPGEATLQVLGGTGPALVVGRRGRPRRGRARRHPPGAARPARPDRCRRPPHRRQDLSQAGVIRSSRPRPGAGAVDRDLSAVRQDPLRPGVAEGHADAHHGIRVVARPRLDHGVALRGALCAPAPPADAAVLEVRRGRPADEHRVGRREQAALAEAAHDPADSRAGMHVLAGLEQEHSTVEHAGSPGKRPAVSIHWSTSRQPPQVRPVTVRAGPAQAHGSVGSRSPKSVSERGSAQSMPKSSDSPGSTTSRRSPVSRAARSDAQVAVVDARSGAQLHLRRPAVEARHALGPQPATGGWCCRCSRGTAWGRRAPGRASRCGMTVIWSSPPIVASTARMSGSAKAALRSSARARGSAPTCRVVGYSTGTRPVSSLEPAQRLLVHRRRHPRGGERR